MKTLTERKWLYPLVYVFLLILSFWPPYTKIPYDPRHAQAVIIEILMHSTRPYAAWGWIFHIATLAVLALAFFRPRAGGRAVATYFGINYLVIAAVQTHAETEQFGLAIQTGALVASAFLGLFWLWTAWRDKLTLSFTQVPIRRWLLLPLALLVFWLPMGMEANRVVFDFNPLLLFTSPDYGLAYCFMTPVLLFLLILAYPRVDGFVFRVTAFNALIYGLLNLIHWFNPDTLVLGVMHLPLLVLALVALFLPRFATRPTERSE